MSETPLSLLERLRQRPDGPSWQRLVDLYTPLIQVWLSRPGLAREDVEDLTQDVLAVLVRELPRFQHNRRTGAFRRWLRTTTANRLRGFWRARRLRPPATGASDFLKMLDQLEDPDSALGRAWDHEHDCHVAHRLAELVEGEFEPATWRAFRRVVMDGRRPADTAVELGLSVNAVLIAKSRVLRRLRQEMRGLTE
jgi:RNA polymerase sigma-70 factor (ECF subfamily)